MDVNRLCMGCMNEVDTKQGICPKCGYKHGTNNSARGLQPQTILNGKYLVGKVIGEGGFGITYIAYDLVLNNRVAIKEYFPSELVTRDTSNGIQTSLTVLTGSKEEQYKKGIDRFVREAGNLAKFNNLPGIVSVKEFFYENNTAYMVMEYIDGVTLSKYLDDNGGKLPYSKVLEMMSPVMDSLEKVHEAGIIHRDISPDNIMVARDGNMKLIDFGAARLVDNNDEKSLTVILKHGYAPEEQYHPDGKQGPWTDIYALSATMYRMITGIVPQESTDRVLNKDTLEPLNKIKTDVPKKISVAIMQGLAVKASHRPQRIADFKEELNKGRKKELILYLGIAVAVALVAVAIIGGINSKKNVPVTGENSDSGVADNSISDVQSSMEESTDELEEESEPKIVEKTEEELIELIENASGYPIIPETQIREEALYAFKDHEQFKNDLSYRIYDDFDGNGVRELFAYVYTNDLEQSFFNDYPYSISNTKLWYTDGNTTYEVTPSAYEHVSDESEFTVSATILCGLDSLRFGRIQDVCEVYANTGSQTIQIMCQTFRVQDGEIRPIIEYQQIGLGSDYENNPIVYDLSESLVCMEYSYFNEALDDEYKGENWKEWGGYLYPYYYIYELNEKYYIYSVKEVSDSALSVYTNHTDIVENVEKAMGSTIYSSETFSLWWNEPYEWVERESIFVSDNDKIYINYLVRTKPSVTEEEDEMWGYPSLDPDNYENFQVTAVYSVKDEKMYLDGFLPGWISNSVSVDNGAIVMNVDTTNSSIAEDMLDAAKVDLDYMSNYPDLPFDYPDFKTELSRAVSQVKYSMWDTDLNDKNAFYLNEIWIASNNYIYVNMTAWKSIELHDAGNGATTNSTQMYFTYHLQDNGTLVYDGCDLGHWNLNDSSNNPATNSDIELLREKYKDLDDMDMYIEEKQF